MDEETTLDAITRVSAGAFLLPSLTSLALAATWRFNVAAQAKLVGNVQGNASTMADVVATQGSSVRKPPAEVSGSIPLSEAPALQSQADLDRLIVTEYAGLRLLLRRRTHDPELASDLLNEAICITWEKWRTGQIAHPQQIAGYVYQVALNLLRNWRRSTAERPDRRADPRTLDSLAGVSPEEPVEQALASKVLRIVDGITPLRDRAVIVRFYLEEEDRDSICADLGMNREQFTKILHRARRRLRELLESRGVNSGDLFMLMMMA